MTESVKSDKKYATAVILSGIFGVLGIHHFYCGRVLHGFFDLTLAIVGIILIQFGDVTLTLIGAGLILIDVIHTVVVTFMLLVGSYRDGKGKLITYPGQKI
ncbi:TM2 domain-containing protein [Shewanella sp. 1_MG-2023]|uniref:TM2 domain-containing protein n=1 Tax=Shewanella electrodiphila TaxID=934143 RepID=A0ABT0KJ21_9GAMM|nr:MULTISPECIES: NINE protein [Shewanella]MCC4833692.1 TM2 domain-containing protein [Shewanella sp. 10N.7]MCL1043748.1 TM2 domain-containing protein [Shewanella electrodiphila]MDO6611233.1 TM2 domain-containing protein [Shewanella sp. 7_MG-2023]MDO6771088.1 TM2 domain-containing protein [Shewanella sp. 2_MG-2023]MDO6796331.1 TM2 domain-containing protein [Shewanella sp. 1_MG-2023]